MATSDRSEYYKHYERSKRKKKARPKITLEPSEHSLFKSLAKQHKRSVPQQIKRMALAYAKNENLFSVEMEERLKETNTLLRNIGRNINQIAHAFNIESRQGDFSPETQESIQLYRSIVEGLKEVRKQIKETLLQPKDAS